MNLWQLLLGVAIVLPASGGFAAVDFPNHTWGLRFAASTAGLVVGAMFAAAMEFVRQHVERRYAHRSEADQERAFRTLFLLAGVWVVVGFLSGFWIGTVISRISGTSAF
jgi:hypothetical protein